MKEKEYYTKLTYELKYSEDNSSQVISIIKPIWDMDADQMLDMFHTIMIGATFHEETFQAALVNYLEDHGYKVEILD